MSSQLVSLKKFEKDNRLYVKEGTHKTLKRVISELKAKLPICVTTEVDPFGKCS